MKLFGVTGGIGMGKSTAARMLAGRDVAVIDTDAIARELVEPGQPPLVEIARQFGPNVIRADGRLDRAALASIVFPDPQRREALEAILHPRIRERWIARVGEWRGEGRTAAAVVIPLLFETDAQSAFDVILCTACTTTTQRERLQARGWSEEQIRQRNEAQWTVERKMAGSTHVLWTEGELEIHERQIERVLAHHLPARR
jgi:dephospho-CoA kinase